jgi:hypothetical protein
MRAPNSILAKGGQRGMAQAHRGFDRRWKKRNKVRPPVGVLRSVAHRRAESRFGGVFIIAVHRAFVLGLGAQHRGIVELSQSVFRCVTVFACYSSSSLFKVQS